jgi:protein SCO1/2
MKAFRVVVALVVLFSVGLTSWLLLDRERAGESFGHPWSKPAPDFSLTNQDDQPFQLSSLRGDVVLLTFGFTHCPNICPTTLANLAAIHRRLPPAEQPKVRTVFVSVDPARDTPEVLKDYVPFFDPSFVGVTGSPAEIARVAKDYGVSYENVYQQSNDAKNYYTVNHSTYIYLIDARGHLRLFFDPEQLHDANRVIAEIERALRG